MYYRDEEGNLQEIYLPSSGGNEEFVFENGSGYIKFENGLLVCFGTSATINIGHMNSNNQEITLPKSYIDTNYTVIATIRHGGAYWADTEVKANSTANNKITITNWNNNATNDAVGISYCYITIGKWK